MPAIHRTAASRQDYLDIFLYVAQHNLPAAERLIKRFDEALAVLSENPHMAPQRADLGSGIRGHPVGNYVLFYRPTRDGISLLRALHGARDLRRIFRPR